MKNKQTKEFMYYFQGKYALETIQPDFILCCPLPISQHQWITRKNDFPPLKSNQALQQETRNSGPAKQTPATIKIKDFAIEQNYPRNYKLYYPLMIKAQWTKTETRRSLSMLTNAYSEDPYHRDMNMGVRRRVRRTVAQNSIM